TALARHLALQGRPVKLWVHDPALAASMASGRRNETYLPGFDLPEPLRVTADLGEACDGASILLLAVPSRHCRGMLAALRDVLRETPPLVVASKGIEQGSLLRVSEIAREVLELPGPEAVAVLSGPSFAREVAAGHPTTVVAASARGELAAEVQSLLTSPRLRVYTCEDPVGVELGGALKNVIAIAAGVSQGAGLGTNTVAALITRGLAEISRLAVALGGRRETLAGLAGLGDLVLTCTGALSRNRSVGISLGEGRSLAETLAGMKMVAEGVDTARSARDLGLREGITMPITGEVNRVLFEGKPPQEAIRDLMERPLRSEFD
ncbi:MAG TPA: NAD(P)H-dependent glycerol-3-phosphate dehydrogenase, partial [Candidatus Saccharimonadales bacterium]|nr:NAD(P)H-dependent glycerol-3-phosphate dehydrogenase [Candidatus Saccharimonadales bacterium]